MVLRFVHRPNGTRRLPSGAVFSLTASLKFVSDKRRGRARTKDGGKAWDTAIGSGAALGTSNWIEIRPASPTYRLFPNSN